MLKQSNKNPIEIRIGIFAFTAGIILFFVTRKTSRNIYLDLATIILFFGGLILNSYGYTKIEIKEDKDYQKFLRRHSVFELIFL